MNMSIVKPLIFAAITYAVLAPSHSRAQWYNTIDNQQQNAVGAENMRRNMELNQQYYQMQQQHQQYQQQQQQYINGLNRGRQDNILNPTNSLDNGGCIGYFSCR